MISAPDRGALARDRPLIQRRYLALLHRDHSSLAEGAGLEQVLSQLDSILESAYSSRIAASNGGPADDKLALSARIGRDRAVAGVHPWQSMHAASLVFEAALPVLSATLAAAGQSEPELAASLALNRSIMDRLSVAAALYVGVLLEKIHGSNRDERRRLSRDLHDVVAPSMAVGLQHLDLFEIYADTDPARAHAKISEARQAVHDALAAMRTLSTESRENVGRDGLRYALAAVLKRGSPETRTVLSVTGDLAVIPPIYCEEIFLLVREAVRNAFSHAQSSNVTVSLRVHDTDLMIYIVDDGIGFEMEGSSPAAGGDGLGLISMAERAQLLGGRVTVTSAVNAGTTVTVRIPRPPSVPAAGLGRERKASTS